ncbi:MAG: cyclic nucleotide-binding domain-containing protein [Burkholderiales bacterium]
MICRKSEVPANGLKECQAEGGLKLVVANSGDEYFAVQATCPHQDVPLCEGIFDGSVLVCHQHLWQWDIRTGAPMGIAEIPLERYDVTVEGDAIYLDAQGALNVGELFNGIAGATLQALAAIARREDFAAGSMIYRMGDPAQDFFVLETGRVEFQIGRAERANPAGFMLKKGEVFGWAALVENHPQRIASARALEDSSVLRIDGRQALKVLESDPAAGFVVMRRLSGLIARFLTPAGAK